MRVFDASSMIYAWDNYPVGQFPGLWEWIAGQIETKELMMSSVAFDEVNHKAPDCGEWLKDKLRQRNQWVILAGFQLGFLQELIITRCSREKAIELPAGGIKGVLFLLRDSWPD